MAIAGGQWYIEVFCFYCKFVLADSLVLPNARYRKAKKVTTNYKKTDHITKQILLATLLALFSVATFGQKKVANYYSVKGYNELTA